MIRSNFIKLFVIATSLSVIGSNAYAAVSVQTFKAPNGFTIKMDEQNYHLHRPVYVAEVSADPEAHAGHNPDQGNDKGKNYPKTKKSVADHSGHNPDQGNDKGKNYPKTKKSVEDHSGHNPDQ